jgi:chromosome segregation ATPase
MELTIPELTAVHIGLLAFALVVGLGLGWIFRGDRSAKEKIAVNAGWQDQLESQQAEQDRLAEQNKSLMEQISQYQASHQDSVNRAKELSETLRESLKAREELQQQLGEFRTKLEAAVGQRDKLQNAIQRHELESKNSTNGLKEKDDKIFHLSRELTSWQSRVPPLVEKFQERDKQARELEEELAKARTRIEAFEEMTRANETRIEPVDAGALPDGLDASNEPHSDTSSHAVSKLQDQIDFRNCRTRSTMWMTMMRQWKRSLKR